MVPTKVSLVSSIGGIVVKKEDQRVYLKKMAEIHLKHYQDYLAAYLQLTEGTSQEFLIG